MKIGKDNENGVKFVFNTFRHGTNLLNDN